jgi:hypothetical protein
VDIDSSGDCHFDDDVIQPPRVDYARGSIGHARAATIARMASPDIRKYARQEADCHGPADSTHHRGSRIHEDREGILNEAHYF